MQSSAPAGTAELVRKKIASPTLYLRCRRRSVRSSCALVFDHNVRSSCALVFDRDVYTDCTGSTAMCTRTVCSCSTALCTRNVLWFDRNVHLNIVLWFDRIVHLNFVVVFERNVHSRGALMQLSCYSASCGLPSVGWLKPWSARVLLLFCSSRID